MYDLRLLTAADFAPHLNGMLQICFPGDVKMPAELIEVAEAEHYPMSDKAPFSIVLRTAQKDRYYPQGIYVLEHPEKGDLSIFLVPLGPDGKGMKYQAVFS